jgi:hypothetical protein
MLVKPAILFFGDSFANTGRACWHKDQLYSKDYPSYQDLICDHFDADQLLFGFAGKGWWYSRHHMTSHLDRNPQDRSRLKAVVCMHTDWGRMLISHDTNDLMVRHDDLAVRPSDPDVVKARKFYYTHLWDGNFHQWAMIQWFRELSAMFPGIPVIHFHCFTETQQIQHYLGDDCVIYTTPLVQISVGERTGTDDEIRSAISVDEKRYNHFGAENNLALAKTIINDIEDYRPGVQEIDLSGFQIVNPNCVRYPDSGFGTR